MTDFLSRLVERSTASTVVPLPVVAPLFAAGPAVPPDAGVESDPGDRPAAPHPTAVAAELPPVPTAPRVPAGETAPVAWRAALDRSPTPVAPLTPARESREPARARAPVTRDPATISARGREVAAALALPLERGVASAAPAPPDRAPPVPLAMPAPPATGAPRREPPVALPPPIVRVSIGRIEVRSVAPAAPPPVRPAPSPRRPGLVLEEYLRSRGRGG